MRREKRRLELEEKYLADRERLRAKRIKNSSPSHKMRFAPATDAPAVGDGNRMESNPRRFESASDRRDEFTFAASDARGESGGGVMSARRHTAAGEFSFSEQSPRSPKGALM